MIPSHREPTHPGEILLEEFLVPLGRTQVAAAKEMDIPLNRLNEIIRGRRGVTADTAIRLAQLLGTTPEFWMNLQSSWDIYQAAEHLDVVLDEPEEAPAATNELRARAWSQDADPTVRVRTQTIGDFACDPHYEFAA